MKFTTSLTTLQSLFFFKKGIKLKQCSLFTALILLKKYKIVHKSNNTVCYFC